MAKSDPLVVALDAATPNRGGRPALIDTWPDDIRAAILRANDRKVSHREIAKILTRQGYSISEGAVRTWLTRHV